MIKRTIAVVEDDQVLNQLIVAHLRDCGYEPHGLYCWADAKKHLAEQEPNLVLLDPRLPDADGYDLLPELVAHHPVIVLTAHGSVQCAVAAMKAGAADFMVKPVNPEELEVVVGRVLETAELREESQFLRNQLRNRRHSILVGRSDTLAKVESHIRAVAPTDVTVLIRGESGVGKELVAREVHENSARSERNFVALDCCTLPEALFESELFGHERGSFTGADRQKKGLIESAAGGTLFLDEIGEIPPPVQAKLLRVLETGHFRRIGGTKDLTHNARVVAATNANLDDMRQDGSFRTDLFYRLSTFVIEVPPLRERREDIPDLVDHFLSHHDFSRRINKRVSSSALKKLMLYDWPGNVRELKNVIERAIILSADNAQISAEQLVFAANGEAGNEITSISFDHEPTLEEMKQRYLEQLLTKYCGHRSTIAKALGISERNTYRLIQKYGLQD